MKSKTLLINIILAAFIAMGACGKKNDNPSPQNTGTTTETLGTFTYNGKKYTGKVSTQTFTDGKYSILCEYDYKPSATDYTTWEYELFQITFANKAAAEKGGTFKVTSSSNLNFANTEVSVFNGNSDLFGTGTQSITVSNKTITINNITLYTRPTNSGTAGIPTFTINAASITF
jgi:major membrane immunogen (membrane-anchored lipoprotein)